MRPVAVVLTRYLAVLGVVLAKAWVGAICGICAGAWFAILSALIRRGGHRRSAQPEKDPHA